MTTERKAPAIVREEVITVQETILNDYGDLMVTTTTGEERKIGVKRSHLFPMFQDNSGRAIKVGYASYMNREYIAKAELFDGKPPIEKQVPEITAGVEKPKPAQPSRNEEITVNMFWNHLKDWLLLKERLAQETKEPMSDYWTGLRTAYFAKMFSVLDIEIKKKGE